MNTVAHALKFLFIRDLTLLKKEIELYGDEEKLWATQGEISNSAGNLCLHLIGNLNTYIGAVLGGSGYIRNRELEFSLKGISKIKLYAMIEQTIRVISAALESLKDDEIKKEYPLIVFENKTSTEYLLIHLATHLNYHLGQINYHRRLLDKINK